MNLFNKLKWILGILMVFILIIATNLIDKNNFVRIRDSVVTIYEDRLIGKDILFEMSKSVHEKEMAIALSDSAFFLQRNVLINNDLDDLMLQLEETNLTSEKEKIVGKLKVNLKALSISEIACIQSGFTEKTAVNELLARVKMNLNDLSTIQMSEGRRELFISKKAIDSIELFTHLEIYILIVLAVLIQIIVIYKPKESKEE